MKLKKVTNKKLYKKKKKKKPIHSIVKTNKRISELLRICQVISGTYVPGLIKEL